MTDRWTHVVEAYNSATESTNKIHDDAVARKFGFRGGLVPGVDVWAYLVHPSVERWGDEFLERGNLTARFDSPVYDGDEVTATLDRDGILELTDPTGAVCAKGAASLRRADDVVEVPEIDRTPLIELHDRPSASESTLATGTTLGTLDFTFDAGKSAAYIQDVRETDQRYVERGISHPGFLARLCNTVLGGSVVLGPWIHVGTDAHHLGVLHHGDEVEVRARVADERQHKGHRFVDLDVVVSAGSDSVYVAAHTAIWRPRQPG